VCYNKFVKKSTIHYIKTYYFYCNSSHFGGTTPQKYRGPDLQLSRPRDVINQVTNQFAKCHFLLVILWNRKSVSNGFRDICIQIYLNHELDLLGSFDVIEHVTIWSPRVISYMSFIATESLSPAVVEIMGLKHHILGSHLDLLESHGVIDHVTDSPYAISYWWSITVFEIFNLRNSRAYRSTHAELSLRTRDITWHAPCPKPKHRYIFELLTSHCLFTMTLLLGSDEEKGVFTLETTDVRWMWNQFEIQKFAKCWPFSGPGGQGVWKVAMFTTKGTFIWFLRAAKSFKPFCFRNDSGVLRPGRFGKKARKSQRFPQERGVAVNTGLELGL